MKKRSYAVSVLLTILIFLIAELFTMLSGLVFPWDYTPSPASGDSLVLFILTCMLFHEWRGGE